MDLDIHFFSALIRGGSKTYYTVKERGIVPSVFPSQFKDVMKFIDDHVLEFGEMPSSEFFAAKTNLEIIEVKDPIDVYIDEIKKRHLWNELRIAYDDVGELLNKGLPKEAFDALQKSIRDIDNNAKMTAKVGSLLAVGKDVMEQYQRIKNGERGILTPWPVFNEMTLGFWPSDLVSVIARLGIGKTWALIMLCREAWVSGKNVLFISPEVSRLNIAKRFYSLHLKLPYQLVRKGRLDETQEQILSCGVREIGEENGIKILGDEVPATIDEIILAVETTKPDIVFVDGMYLVKNSGATKHEIVSNTADDLKRIAKEKNIVVVCSQQFNREGGTSTRAGIRAENIGLSDALGWNSDLLLGMYQLDDMKQDKTMGWRPMKLREGEGFDFYTRWDFQMMDFGQMARDGGDVLSDWGTDISEQQTENSDQQTQDEDSLF